ncbi:hypothetical protein HZH66_014838 [Vespula vulgaris]|uniref:Uncharacterized protein n=1 Tax=Vespula vulgaris TaxID=7454 RepID=A0A834J2I1_VESVU|nr:hypothetical protein HZH66_014838 [Vespula vulgaris]
MSTIEYPRVTCAKPALKVISQYGRWGIARQACTSHSYTTSRENFTSGFLKRCFPTNVGCFQGFHVIGFASCWRYRRMVAPLSLRRVWLETSGWMNRARASQRVYVDGSIEFIKFP